MKYTLQFEHISPTELQKLIEFLSLHKYDFSPLPNDGKPDVIGSLPLSEDDLKEEVKSLYVANYKDYAFVNADESFRDGIALGCWGMNEKLKRQ